MGYTYILRHGHCYRNTFFYPHGACFTLVYPGCFSFYVYVCAVCYCVCPVLPCGVACFAWSCVSGVLPLLASCDRVSGSCGLVWSWSRGLVTVNPRYYYRITLNTITMEEHDIDALIDMAYGDEHLYGSDE